MSIAIRVDNLGKRYQLGATHAGSVRELVNRGWNRMLGRSQAVPQTMTLDPEAGDRVEGKSFWALRDVSFEVKQGEVVGIIGRNGSGKSTLLKILSQITAPTTGRVELHGRVASLLEVGTGFHPELSGRENVFLNGAILGMTKPEIRRKFDEIVAFAEIEKFIDTPVKRYSSGMYVRLAFAVAAHLEPEILIVDEVLAVGDADFQKKCLGKMGDVARGGRTVLFVSHNMPAVQRLSDRGILLEKGQILQSGDVDGCLNAYIASTPLVTASEDGIANLDHPPVGRRGTGRVLIERVELSPPNGRPKGVFMMGEPMRVRMTIRSQAMFSSMAIGFSFIASDGSEIQGSAAHDGGIETNLAVGSNVFECVVSPMVLVPGSYTVRAAIFAPSESFDHVDEVMRFRVDPARYANAPTPRDHYVGNVYLGYDWRRLPLESTGEVHENANSKGNQRCTWAHRAADLSSETGRSNLRI
jgi:lipopolysaccharide transport system ATP-binding protein